MNLAIEKTSTSSLKFGVDSFLPTKIAGWVRNLESDEPVVIDVVVNGLAVGSLRADRFRSDLQKIRPDGRFAFAASPFGALDWQPMIAKQAVVQLRDRATGLVIGECTWDGSAPVGQQGVRSQNGSALRLNKGLFVVPLSERSVEWRRQLLNVARQVSEGARTKGFDLAICYGTLLGFVRDGDLIGHDDDVDMMFVSRRTSMLEAVEEFYALQDTLKAEGWSVRELSNGQIHVYQDAAFAIDIFLAWLENEKLRLTFTVNGAVDACDILPFGEATLYGVTLPSPREPDPLLRAIYGPAWRVPDPAFNWQRPREIAEFFAPIHNYRRGAHVDYWRSYYAQRSDVSPPQLPSQFALFALSARGLPGTIVDVGCGSGRDSLFFAAHGIPTIGLDYAQTAIENNRATAAERGLTHRAEFHQIDVSNLHEVQDAVNVVLEKRSELPLCVYSRFFFHALDEAAESAALLLVQKLLSGEGDYAAFEFRTKHDAARQKVTPPHYRRYIDVDEFVRKARNAYGLECTYRAEGTGFAIFRDDDAHVVRLVLVSAGGSGAGTASNL